MSIFQAVRDEDDGGLGRVLRLPLIASFCEGGHAASHIAA
jgi:hypothetical protein